MASGISKRATARKNRTVQNVEVRNMEMTTGDKATDIRVLTLLLTTKILALEKEGDLNMWDEVITHMKRQRDREKETKGK
jgi:hypothetical protein